VPDAKFPALRVWGPVRIAERVEDVLGCKVRLLNVSERGVMLWRRCCAASGASDGDHHEQRLHELCTVR
jgi:hypothetical protein